MVKQRDLEQVLETAIPLVREDIIPHLPVGKVLILIFLQYLEMTFFQLLAGIKEVIKALAVPRVVRGKAKI